MRLFIGAVFYQHTVCSDGFGPLGDERSWTASWSWPGSREGRLVYKSVQCGLSPRNIKFQPSAELADNSLKQRWWRRIITSLILHLLDLLCKNVCNVCIIIILMLHLSHTVSITLSIYTYGEAGFMCYITCKSKSKHLCQENGYISLLIFSKYI